MKASIDRPDARSREETASPGPERLSDASLLAGLGGGDADASEEFVSRFERVVFGVALSVVRDRGLAEDAAQEAFERAWRSAEAYDPRRGSVRTWLTTIARNVALDLVRVRRVQPVDDDELEPMLTTPSASPSMRPMTRTPETHALAGEDAAQLRGALADLPSEQARAAVLTAVHGHTAAQLAELEEIPLGTAKSRIRLALGKLHESVARSQR